MHQDLSNCDTAEKQLQLHMDESISRLKGLWSQQGYLANIDGKYDHRFFMSKLLPVVEKINKIILNEEHELEQSKSEIQDYFLEIEELCSVLNRDVDDYISVIHFCNSQSPYLIKPKLINNLTNLKNEISARRVTIQEAYNQSQLIGPEVYINPEFTNCSLTDVSSHIYNPIINEASRLSMIKTERINSFNTSVSWIFHKWNTLCITPTEKDDIDIALEILFQSDLPNEVNVESIHEHGPCCPDEKHLFYDWYSKVTEKDILNLSIPVIKILIKKSEITIEIQNDKLKKEEMYDQLKKLYRIASIGPEDQNSVLDSNGKILSHKLGEEHSRILQLIDNNKEALHQSLLEKLNKIWVDCSVSKENIDKGMKEIEDRGVSLETLELMINDCDYQKFQLENAPDIYDKIRKRKLIIDRLREFEANLNKKSKDRFKGSSLNFAAEEKFRKENYPKLGRLEDSLIEPIKLYERKYHKHFLFEGGHFLTILQSSIQRRNGNVEIIGVNDAACEVSFASRPSLPRLQPTTVKSTKDTLKPAEPQNGKSSRLSTKSRLSNSNNLRADSQAAARSGKTTPSLRSPVPQNGKSSRLSTNSKLSNVNRLRIDPQTTERSRRSTPLQKSPESENKKGTSHSFDKLSQANNVQVDSQGLKKFGKSNTLLKSPEFEPVVSPPKSASSSRKSSILSHSKLDIVYEELDSVDSDSCPASSLMLKSSSETLTIDTVITPTNVNVSSVQNSFKNNSQGQLNDMKPLPTKAKVQPKLPTQLPAKSNLSSKSVPNVKQEQIKIGPIAKTTSPRTVTKTPTSIAKAPSRTGGRASTPLKKASSLQPKTQTTQTTPIISKPTLKVRPSKLTIEAKETGLDARPQIKPTPPIKPSSNLKGSKGNITPSLVPQAQPKLVS